MNQPGWEKGPQPCCGGQGSPGLPWDRAIPRGHRLRPIQPPSLSPTPQPQVRAAPPGLSPGPHKPQTPLGIHHLGPTASPEPCRTPGSPRAHGAHHQPHAAPPEPRPNPLTQRRAGGPAPLPLHLSEPQSRFPHPLAGQDLSYLQAGPGFSERGRSHAGRPRGAAAGPATNCCPATSCRRQWSRSCHGPEPSAGRNWGLVLPAPVGGSGASDPALGLCQAQVPSLTARPHPCPCTGQGIPKVLQKGAMVQVSVSGHNQHGAGLSSLLPAELRGSARAAAGGTELDQWQGKPQQGEGQGEAVGMAETPRASPTSVWKPERRAGSAYGPSLFRSLSGTKRR